MRKRKNLSEYIFEKAWKSVCKDLKIKKSDLFSPNRAYESVNNRYLLFYVCSKNLLKLRQIEELSNMEGLDIDLATISRGIAKVQGSPELQKQLKTEIVL